MRKLWSAIRSAYPTRRGALLAALVGALGIFVVAFGFMIAGAGALAWTNTEKFCIGCHEMRDNVYAEYKGTVHDTNRTGVRAICPDCHVPREPGPMLLRKVRASFELWGHIVGTLDTKEKFEKNRARLAHNVWRRMKETDSLECRNCHHFDRMDPEKQSAGAKAVHATAKGQGKTCIDCHFGIAHKEPEGPGPAEMKF